MPLISSAFCPQKSKVKQTDLERFIHTKKCFGVDCIVNKEENTNTIYLMLIQEDIVSPIKVKSVKKEVVSNTIFHYTKITFDLQGKFICQEIK